jgi:DNA replication protein DnaC
LIQLAKTEVLVLDDWGVSALDPATRSDLLEIIDDRAANKATIITTQLPVDHWHAWIGDETVADAILDRVMQRVHRINLGGDSLRLSNRKTTQKEANLKRT